MKRDIHCIITKKALFKNEFSIESDFTVPAIFIDNSIKYIEPDKTKTNIIYSSNKLIVERKNNAYSKLELVPSSNTIYIMKTNFGYNLQMNIYTLSLELSSNSIKATYQTETDKDNLEIHSLLIEFL